MNHYQKALSARCEVAMLRVSEAIGICATDDVLVGHGCSAYEQVHNLGYAAYKSGEQPSELIKLDATLFKCWSDGFDDARCDEAIGNCDHFYM